MSPLKISNTVCCLNVSHGHKRLECGFKTNTLSETLQNLHANNTLWFTTKKAKHESKTQPEERRKVEIWSYNNPQTCVSSFFAHLLTVISSCLLLSGNLHTHDSLRTRDTLGREAGRENERTQGEKAALGLQVHFIPHASVSDLILYLMCWWWTWCRAGGTARSLGLQSPPERLTRHAHR